MTCSACMVQNNISILQHNNLAVNINLIKQVVLGITASVHVQCVPVILDVSHFATLHNF